MYAPHRIASFVSLAGLTALASCNTLPADPPPADSIADRAAALEPLVARIRDLSFKQDVPVAEQDRSTLKSVLDEAIAKDWDASGALQERAWKQFGLLPREFDWRAKSTDYVKERTGGYYDPATKRLYAIADQADADDSDAEDGRMWVLAHELTHAVDDQHFDLGTSDATFAHDDDRALAFRSVCEGNATDVGTEVLLDRFGFPGSTASPLLRAFPWLAAKIAGGTLGRLSINGNKLVTINDDGDAPAVIQAETGFQYAQGWGFTNRIRSEFGWESVNAAFANPPESTEQVIYPERFLDRLDRPHLIEMPPAPAGFREVYQQSLGLMRTRVLLADRDGGDSIDGWDGDRYVLWETPTGDALGWLTVWDSVSEAEDFEIEWSELLLRLSGPSGTTAIVRDGDRVAAVMNDHDGRAQSVAQHLLTARVTRQDGDEGPDRWYWRALRWPLSIRSLHTANEFKLVDDWGIDWRSHDDGFKLRLLNSLALHTENNPDRFAFWTLCGLIGGASDRTIDYSYARVPLLFTWHGRNAGSERRARFGLALNSIEYENDREHKSFDLLWGVLFHAQWGERERESSGRLLFIPLWW
jgi:hypothetical protein